MLLGTINPSFTFIKTNAYKNFLWLLQNSKITPFLEKTSWTQNKPIDFIENLNGLFEFAMQDGKENTLGLVTLTYYFQDLSIEDIDELTQSKSVIDRLLSLDYHPQGFERNEEELSFNNGDYAFYYYTYPSEDNPYLVLTFFNGVDDCYVFDLNRFYSDHFESMRGEFVLQIMSVTDGVVSIDNF